LTISRILLFLSLLFKLLSEGLAASPKDEDVFTPFATRTALSNAETTEPSSPRPKKVDDVALLFLRSSSGIISHSNATISLAYSSDGYKK
jgi:hypothetical protein